MSDDRLAQARNEYHEANPGITFTNRRMTAVDFGVQWADANPKPRTITRAEFLEALDAHVGLGASGDWVTVEDMLIAAFMAAGIEVRDE